jgi:5'-3' exonuclease
MGVPSFYRKLVGKYKNIIKNKLNGKIEALYIDANCLFHPECFKVLEYYPKEGNQDKLFKLMVKRIIDKIDYLIELCDPNLVYVAVDGVCPLAKINQQRVRRFGYSNNYKNDIYKKYGIEKNTSWSNIVISPGTKFMFDLHNYLLKHFKKSKRNIIYDSYMTAGEGEHKILQHMKKKYSNHNNNPNLVVYGLDADLIFLCMSSQLNNIYLMREADQFGMLKLAEGEKDRMIYADIDFTKECINSDFNGTNKKITVEMFSSDSDSDEYFDNSKLDDLQHNTNFINDYIFICYFMGNDFLPHLPSLDIKMDGLDIVKEVYLECFQTYQTNLVNIKNNVITFNNEFLLSFLYKLGEKEKYFFKDTLTYHMAKHKRRRCFETEKYKKDIWYHENLKNVIIKDAIKLHEDGYKERYYQHYFKTNKYKKETINKICHNYLEGIKWVSQYYFDTCDSWRWQYKYTHPPFLSDIYDYLKNKNINDIIYPKGKPLKIYEQLVSIIPYKYNHILPFNLRYLSSSVDSELIDMFPIGYESDMIYKTQLYKCIPILPYLEIDRVIDIVSKIKLDIKDIERSKKLTPFHFK